MKFQGITTALAAALVLATSASSAQAAMTVLGNGLGVRCYRIAEFKGDAKSGVATCTLALENTALSYKDRAATLINRGILKTRIDDLRGALADYEAGLRLDDRMGEAYVDRGAALISLRRYREALNDINHGLALNTKRPEIAHYNRAIAREALGDIRGAYEDLKTALEIEPNFGPASMQLQRFRVVRRVAPGGT